MVYFEITELLPVNFTLKKIVVTSLLNLYFITSSDKEDSFL
ncbi:hypothetical protein STAAUR107093_09255 [Staphylococcus aureus]|nr:hypothetical protein Tgr_1153 [Staphylococcus aureus subsp. aureus Tager 104]EGS99027.1 hypothetical protein SA21195_0710 [Staphylococcus aureus subsp. aureus 21195]